MATVNAGEDVRKTVYAYTVGGTTPTVLIPLNQKLVLIITVDKNKDSGSLIRYLNPAVLRL